MDYQQSRAYIRDAEQYAGGALDLTNIKEIMKRLGNPQDQLKYVHVAGTNGKGSVIAYLYTTLTNADITLDGIFPHPYILTEKRSRWREHRSAESNLQNIRPGLLQ